MKLRTVMFDLDGTLVDSVGDLTAALVDFLEPHGFPPFGDHDVRRWMGTDADDIIAGLQQDFGVVTPPEFDLQEKARAFLDFYDRYPHGRSKAYDGAAELLAALKEDGLAIGVCTNKREALSREILTDLGLMEHIDAIAGADTTPHKKPDPAPLYHVLDQTGATPAEAVMIGDSISDIRAGKAAGVSLVIGADYGYPRKPADLDDANIRIAGLAEVAAIVRNHPSGTVTNHRVPA